ncbi:MAG: restriction endonuclease [Ardenticatenaceae bacterium]|nr:restriction endonuclease [Ardenticatenaceae bacterium]
MAQSNKNTTEWREFEKLVARIEADASLQGLEIKSPDRIPSKITGRKREVDVSIRSKIGTTEILVTIECRKRKPKQDVTWIEQLASKKEAIGASRTIAVSSSGFSSDAELVAEKYGIDLRMLNEVTTAEISALMKIDFVLFNHPSCQIARVGLRYHRTEPWDLPNPEIVDYILPDNTDVLAPIFTNVATDETWSLNHLWKQLQEATNPLEGVPRDGTHVLRTACFPYPGNVTVNTPDGTKILGDVLLTLDLAIEVEMVHLDDAQKVEYGNLKGEAIQRVEFKSAKDDAQDFHISLQMPKDSNDTSNLKVNANWPKQDDSDQ